MKNILIALVLIVFVQCNNKKEVKNDILAYSTNEYVMEDGNKVDGYYVDREKFIQPYVSIKYLEDTIKVSTLHEINSCGKTTGNIEVIGDTIRLLTHSNSDVSCSSVKFNKFYYTIINSKRKKYFIIP